MIDDSSEYKEKTKPDGFLFPVTKFAKENSLKKQLEHMESEYIEILDAYGLSLKDKERTAEEILDLWHSCETAIVILRKEGLPDKWRPLAKEDKPQHILDQVVGIGWALSTATIFPTCPYMRKLIYECDRVLRTLEANHGVDVEGITEAVEEKNRCRGYYKD